VGSCILCDRKTGFSSLFLIGIWCLGIQSGKGFDSDISIVILAVNRSPKGILCRLLSYPYSSLISG